MNGIRNEKRKRLQSFEYEDIGCCDTPRINGNNVCTHCGTVIGPNLVSTERRAYTIEEINSRKRTEPRWRKFGSRTVIPTSRRDAKGKKIGIAQSSLFSRLSKIHNSLVTSIERNLWEAYPKMKILKRILYIPDHIMALAWKIYARIAENKFTTGRSIDGFIAASLYAAIRVHGFPRLLEEICEASKSPRKTVHRSLGMIIKEVLPELNLKYKPITAEQLVFRFGIDLKLPLKIQKDATKILKDATKNGIRRAGKAPTGLAACVVYMAAKKNKEYRKTQLEVSKVANITEVTLRSRSKEIKAVLGNNI